jgi:2-succinyl-6-hydroxy-2,4-cyclohexadiene-1-carboxylate synthase
MRTLVFIHGFLGCKRDFKKLTDLLNDRYLCHSFDLPGHGSESLKGASFDAFLEKIKENHLIGYSMGGRLSLLFAEKYPHLVKKLIIISSHLGLESKQDKERRFSEDLAWVKKMESSSTKEFIESWYNQPLFDSLRQNKEVFLELTQRRSTIDTKPLAKILPSLSVAKQKSLWSALDSFEQDILFLCGEKDEKYRELYGKIPPSPKRKIQFLPGVGHAPHLENPQMLKDALIHFLQES